MKFVQKAIQVGFVWLMAVTTLIASVPHFDCICPNGQRKLFCLGLPTQRPGCCCGGACCSSSGGKCCCQAQDSPPGEQAEQTCCCCESQPHASNDTSTSGIQAKGNCCKKTLAHDEFVNPTTQDAKQNLADGFSVPLLQFAPLLPAPRESHLRFSRHRYELPPPPDLVITLQHFLI